MRSGGKKHLLYCHKDWRGHAVEGQRVLQWEYGPSSVLIHVTWIELSTEVNTDLHNTCATRKAVSQDMSRPLIAEVLCCITKMLRWRNTCFMWVPSHVGLAGNSAADTAAKAALLMPVSNLTLPYSDYFPLIRTRALNQWHSSWSLETQNKLHAIEPTVNITKSYRLPCRDEIIIHRLRIGHTLLTHGHLLKRDSPPHCCACQTQLTVEHVLLRCPTWNAIRVYNNFIVTSLLDLFNQVTPRCIVDFI